MKIALALIVIMSINVYFFLGQVAIQNINPNAPEFFTYDGSLLSDYDAGNFTIDEDIKDNLPTGGGSVSPSTGNVFTDTFTSVKNWFLGVTGLNYLIGIVNGFPNWLKSTGLPIEWTFALGALWQAITFFLVVAFVVGRNP